MREIPLTKGYIAIVDDEDYQRVMNAGKWYSFVHRRTVYAAKGHTVLLHRFIMGITDRKIQVDHKDHNGLNCKKDNLRVCTNKENHQNMRKTRIKTSSQYKGVNWYARDSNWAAHIKKNGKTKHLGYFADEQTAALAYDRAARELFGEFAHCNLP